MPVNGSDFKDYSLYWLAFNGGVITTVCVPSVGTYLCI